MNYLVYLAWRMASVVAIVIGINLANGTHASSWVPGVLVFVLGLTASEAAVRQRVTWQLLPYRWTCPICKNKKIAFELKSSDPNVLNAMTVCHNERDHLWEY